MQVGIRNKHDVHRLTRLTDNVVDAETQERGERRMSTALKITSCSNDVGGIAAHDHFPLLSCRGVNDIQRHTAADRHDAADVICTYLERVGERYVPEVVSPE